MKTATLAMMSWLTLSRGDPFPPRFIVSHFTRSATGVGGLVDRSLPGCRSTSLQSIGLPTPTWSPGRGLL